MVATLTAGARTPCLPLSPPPPTAVVHTAEVTLVWATLAFWLIHHVCQIFRFCLIVHLWLSPLPCQESRSVFRCCCWTLPPVLFLWQLYGIYEICPCSVRKTQIQPWQKQGSSFFSLTQQAECQAPGTSSSTALVSLSQFPTSSPRCLLQHLQPLLHTSQLERKNRSRGHTQFLKQLILPLLNDHWPRTQTCCQSAKKSRESQRLLGGHMSS